MLTRRHITISFFALAALSLSANAQPPAPPPPGTSTTITTTTTRTAPSPALNTDTNSQPDMTGTSGHPDTDVRIRQGLGRLATAMANFSVRTGLEIRANKNAQVVVANVRPETPAARAGVERGDVITSVGSDEVITVGAFQQLISRQPTQSAFFLTLKRGDQSFRVPLGRQVSLMGMTVFPDRADRPVVVDLDRSSPAAYAGFQVGDMIMGFNRQATPTMDRLVDFGIPFIRSVAVGRGIPVQVVREGKPVQLSITRPADAELPVLTRDQERHLQRLAIGVGSEPLERPVIRQTTTTMTRTRGAEVIDPAGNPVVGPPVPYGGVGAYGAGFAPTIVSSDVLGMALPVGSVPGIGPPTTVASANEFGPVQNANAAVAVLYGGPSNAVQQALMPSPVTTVTASTPGLNAGVVGFVQIQANLAGPAVPSANPAVTTPPQSFVSARIAGIPAGRYTLVVNQYGDCGDPVGASAGAAALTLGMVVVNADGRGLLQTQTINYPPQAFLGRVVSLVPVGAVLPGQPQNAPSAVQANANFVACGVIGLSNPRRAVIGGNMAAAGAGPPVVTTTTAARPPIAPAPEVPPNAAPPAGLPQPVSP
jgi:hypothetical protein